MNEEGREEDECNQNQNRLYLLTFFKTQKQKQTKEKKKNLVYKLLFIIDHYHCDFHCDLQCSFQSVKCSNRVINGVYIYIYTANTFPKFNYKWLAHTHKLHQQIVCPPLPLLVQRQRENRDTLYTHPTPVHTSHSYLSLALPISSIPFMFCVCTFVYSIYVIKLSVCFGVVNEPVRLSA